MVQGEPTGRVLTNAARGKGAQRDRSQLEYNQPEGQGTQTINHGRPVSHIPLWSPAIQYGRPERLYTRGDASNLW